MIENARGAAPFDRGRRAGLKGLSKRSNPFDQPGRQTQSGMAWERKCSEWDEGWSAGNAERMENASAPLTRA
jgi:ribosome modulation factor